MFYCHISWAVVEKRGQSPEKLGPGPNIIINCNRPKETTPMGLKVSTCGLKECLETVAKKLDWKKKSKKGKCRGKGMASLVHVGGGARIYRSDASGLI
ncbi:MAG: molybdopterin-dependent oxidoreductase, partial [Firmicutes bacterium]|nr:molybdopterin-dependent oxidoreductase [Bacillota bacterium]